MSSTSSSRAWDALNPALSPWVFDAVSSMGFSKMTPVQASTIPLFIGHKDVVVEAVTGSGKTLAFLIPLVERLLHLEEPNKKHHVSAIIVSPTRELAAQIDGVLKSLIAFHAPSAEAMRSHDRDELESDDQDQQDSTPDYSGMPRIVSQLLVGGSTTPAEDLRAFLDHSPNILIGSPGRLVELISSPKVHCPQSTFEVLVLDEADRLLDLGFKNDLQKIISSLPKQRRTGLFSASVSEAVDQLIRVGLRNPVRIAVKVKGASGKHDQRTPTSLQMKYRVVPLSQRIPLLSKILQRLQPQPLRTIVYMSTCAAVDYFQHVLPPLFEGFSLVPLHGKHPPAVREKNFKAFSNSVSPSILLTTDVAARGLDIPQVDLVVQIDPPSDPKAFLHRCGRAGRAGRKGLAVVFLRPGHEEDYIRFLEVRGTPVTSLELSDSEVSPADAEDATRRIRKAVLTDRAWYEKAQRGFVSWVQSYRKHQASSIFTLSDLDWNDLSESWGLLKMPRMPELKKWEGDHSLGLEIDFRGYAYRDKTREKQRKAELNGEHTGVSNGTAKAPKPEKRAWSDKLDQQSEKERRRAVKKAKKDHIRIANMTPAEREKEAEVARLIEAAKNHRLQEKQDTFEGFSD